MSSCVGNTCGTGDWDGPQPGDPDNNIALSARVVYGGVLLSWTYPLINGNAVAHTDVFRGVNSTSSAAILLDKAGGSSYLDRVDPGSPTEYFYWIEVVSIHGTRGARIGPVSATAVPRVEQTLESLTGRIDEGLLAQTLKTSIAGITLNNQAIFKEVQDRLASNVALQNALMAVQGDLDEALTYVLNETTQRVNADGALVNQINAIAAGLNAAQAAIVNERTVRATNDEAMAQTISTMNGQFGANEAAIIEERELRVTADAAIATRYDALYGRVGAAEGAITEITNVTVDINSALTTRVTNLASTVEETRAAIQTVDTALTNKVESVASSVQTVEASVNGNVATGQVGLSARVNAVTGSLDSMYTAKVQANGLIGGFGIWNNGAEVQAGFDVDTFWIGRTDEGKVKPFIIADNKVFMNEAYIRTASIDSLKIKGESVTVPIASTVNWDRRGKGEGTWETVNEIYMSLEQAGMVYILMTANQGFSNNQRYWQFVIRVDGQDTNNVMGRQAESGPVLSKVIALQAGVHKIEVRWSAHPDVQMGYCDIFAMGVKR